MIRAARIAEIQSVDNACSFESMYPGSEVLRDDERCLMSLVNGKRIEARLHPLRSSRDLVHLARTKAWDIVHHRYFSHDSPTLGSIYDMVRSAGIPFGRVAENLGRGANVTVVHSRLVTSPGHRRNILSEHHHDAGFGVVAEMHSGVVVVQVFLGW